MSQTHTFHEGNMSGPGPDLRLARIGEHDPGPLQYAPAHWLGQLGWDCYELGSKFAAADFTIAGNGTGNATAMTANGLQLKTGSAANTDDQSIQHLRTFTPVAGKRAILYGVFSIDDIATAGLYIGFANTAADFFGTEATHNGGLYMAKSSAGALLTRSKDGTTASNYSSTGWVPNKNGTAAAYTIAADTDYEVQMMINGVTSVDVWVRTAFTGAWSMISKTTNLPTAALRPSAYIENGTAAAKNLLLKDFRFWLQRAA